MLAPDEISIRITISVLFLLTSSYRYIPFVLNIFHLHPTTVQPTPGKLHQHKSFPANKLGIDFDLFLKHQFFQCRKSHPANGDAMPTDIIPGCVNHKQSRVELCLLVPCGTLPSSASTQCRECCGYHIRAAMLEVVLVAVPPLCNFGQHFPLLSILNRLLLLPKTNTKRISVNLLTASTSSLLSIFPRRSHVKMMMIIKYWDRSPYGDKIRSEGDPFTLSQFQLISPTEEGTLQFIAKYLFSSL